MSERISKFLPKQWRLSDQDKIEDQVIRIITVGEVLPLLCNVLDDDREELTEVEANRVAHALLLGDAARTDLDSAIISALQDAFDPREDWSEIDKDFIAEQKAKNE